MLRRMYVSCFDSQSNLYLRQRWDLAIVSHFQVNRINVRNHATSVFRGRTDLAHSAVDQPTVCIDFDVDHWRGSDGSNCSSYFEGEVNHGRCAEVKNDSGVLASEACCVACSQHNVS